METFGGLLVLGALVALIVGLVLAILRWRSKDAVAGRSVGIAFALAAASFFLGLALFPTQEKGPSVAAAPSSSAIEPASSAPAETFSVNLPDEQIGFLQLVIDAREAYTAAPNELKKSSVKVQRGKDLAALLPDGTAEEWYGQVEEIGTTGEANAYVVLRMPESDIWVKTWNNEISDVGNGTLIQHGSKLYTALSDMEVGQWVIFKARLLREGSLTEEGGMTEPEFVARFFSIRPAFVREDGSVYKGAG